MKPLASYLFFVFFLLTVVFLSSFALAHADGSVYNDFLQCLKNQSQSSTNVSDILYSKESTQYNSILTAYIRNLRFSYPTTPKPVLIVTPLTVSHVSAAVICSRDHGLHLKIRSGGHDYEGISYVSDDAFVIVRHVQLKSHTGGPRC
uniref:FAD-binding PCMH-type domain-containing protein n=1 Tax=Opuntia streptacantha TaxID=393608 RepID=A0A7C9F095_OPUST